MNDTEKSIEMEHLVELARVLKAPSKEDRQQILEGGSILIDLDWPYKFIVGRKMCERAIQGQVPRYLGRSSRVDYEMRWRLKDRKVTAHFAHEI